MKEFKPKDLYENPSSLDKVMENRTLTIVLLEKAKTLLAWHKVKKDQNLLKKAFECYELSLDLLDKQRFEITMPGTLQNFLQDQYPIYEKYLELAHQLYEITKNPLYIHKAFEAAERSKTILLLSSLRENEAKAFAGIPPKLLEKEQSLKLEVAFYERQLSQATQNEEQGKMKMYQDKYFTNKLAYEGLIKSFEKDYPKYYQLKYNIKVASLPTLQKRLSAKTALIEYFVGDSSIYIFKATDKDILFKKVKKEADFESKVHHLRKSLIDYEFITNEAKEAYKTYTQEAYHLYKNILSPVIVEKEEIDHLILVPDGVLNYIPFEALLLLSTPAAKAQINYKNLSYLLNKYSTHYIYSATLWTNNQNISTKTPLYECLAFAPSYNQTGNELALRGDLVSLRNTHGSLPGAQAEVQALSKYFSGSFRFGQAATKAAFKAQAKDFKIIHLAMHGIINFEAPLYSRLAFAEISKDEEGNNLYVHELFDMNLQAKLVVLSACETGYGKILTGEGVMSLARGFMYTGVPSLVVSLWKIEDKASALIMQDFYKHLASGMSKNEALNKAKLTYLKGADELSSHPFFWAGFVVVGDAEPLVTSYKLYYWIAASILTLLLVIGMLKFTKYRAKKA